MPSSILTLYVDDKLGVPRGASVRVEQNGKNIETLSVAEELTIGGALTADSFAFAPPAGAKLQEAAKFEAVPYAKVQAIFDRACGSCHGNSGGLSLDSHASVMSGARGRPVIVPGDPSSHSLNWTGCGHFGRTTHQTIGTGRCFMRIPFITAEISHWTSAIT